MFRITGSFKFETLVKGKTQEIPFMPFVFAFDNPDFTPVAVHAENAVHALLNGATCNGKPMVGCTINAERLEKDPETISEKLKAMEVARAEFKAFVLKKSKLFINPKHHDKLDDDDKFVQTIGSLTGAGIGWDIGLAREAAARILEDVNDHQMAETIRKGA